jgi:hypothetical protein
LDISTAITSFASVTSSTLCPGSSTTATFQVAVGTATRPLPILAGVPE